MRNIKKYTKLLGLLTAALCAFMHLSNVAFAYDYDSYEETEEGEWIVDNFHGEPNSVTMYMYVEPTNDNLYTKDYYYFTCTNGDFPDYPWGDPCDHAVMVFPYRPENKKVFTTLSQGDVWIWQFGLENGTYSFAEGANLNHKYTFSRDYKILEWLSENNMERDEIVLDGEDSVRIYVINGSMEWRDSVRDEFVEWAKTNEDTISSVETGMVASGEENTQVIKVDAPAIVEETPTPVNTKKPQITIEPVLKEPEPENPGPDIWVFVKGGIAIAILAFLGFFVAKKKR